MEKVHASPESEMAVLSLLFLDSSLIDVVREKGLPADIFHDRRNRIIFETIMDIGGIVDGIIVMDRLKDDGRLEMAGGLDHLTAITDSFPDIGALDNHLTVLKVKRTAREAIQAAQEAISRINMTNDPSEALSLLEGRLSGLHDPEEQQSVREIIDAQLDVDDRICRGIPVGLPFPWEKIQKATHGIPFASVTPLAGRDGRGKSWMGVALTEHWVNKLGIGILYMPFEDTSGRFAKRLACSIGEYDGFRLFRNPTDQYMKTHHDCMNRLANLPIFMHDTPCKPEEIEAIIANHVKDHNIKGVVIDSFKDIMLPNGENQTSSEGAAMSALVRAAKKHNVAIVVIQHLRDLEDDAWISKREIRGNKVLTQSARLVLMFQNAGFPSEMLSKYGLGDDDVVLEESKSSYGRKVALTLTMELEKARFVEKKELGNGGYYE